MAFLRLLRVAEEVPVLVNFFREFRLILMFLVAFSHYQITIKGLPIMLSLIYITE